MKKNIFLVALLLTPTSFVLSSSAPGDQGDLAARIESLRQAVKRSGQAVCESARAAPKCDKFCAYQHASDCVMNSHRALTHREKDLKLYEVYQGYLRKLKAAERALQINVSAERVVTGFKEAMANPPKCTGCEGQHRADCPSHPSNPYFAQTQKLYESLRALKAGVRKLQADGKLVILTRA